VEGIAEESCADSICLMKKYLLHMWKKINMAERASAAYLAALCYRQLRQLYGNMWQKL